MRLAPVRPRFRCLVDRPLGDCLQLLERPHPNILVDTAGHHATVTVAKPRRKHWSPAIQLDLAEENGRTVIRGLVGPQPAVWTLYAFIAVNILTVAIFAVVVALTQMMLSKPPTAFWAVPVSLVLLLGLYAGSQIGRSLADEQSEELRSFIRERLRPLEECDALK